MLTNSLSQMLVADNDSLVLGHLTINGEGAY